MRKIVLITMSTVCLLSLIGCATTGFKCPSTDCYTTETIGPSDFVKDEGDTQTIIPLELKCKEGYVMTGIKLQPETDPQYYSQYIIVSEVTCCRCE